jgi:glycosyltransferase involved in cell wall biosynthesis
MTVIENAVDFESASFSVENRVSGRQALQLPQDAVVIGAIGRLEPVKRFDTLIQAVAPILLKEDAFLVIVGEGSLRSSLEARVHELGIDHRTLLVGARSDATSLLSAFDLFVSPSNDETFGRAVLEAVGNGLPTIYAECPAIDELAEHPPAAVKLSLQIPDEVDALRLAIGKQLQHLVRYPIPDELGLRFGAGQVAEAYEELYHRLLDDLPVSRARLHRLTRTQQTRR